jgi:ABC-type sugar transport system ATPase subunit
VRVASGLRPDLRRLSLLNDARSEPIGSGMLAPHVATAVSLTLSGIEKKLGGQPILRGIDLEVDAGELAVLVGPSGCGKSTLLRTVAGLEEADAGTIRFGDRDVTHLPPRDRDLGMVFQSYALYPHLTVRENLAFGLSLRGADHALITSRVKEASEMLGLGTLLERLPKALSGGQRQRVAMGRSARRFVSRSRSSTPSSAPRCSTSRTTRSRR